VSDFGEKLLVTAIFLAIEAPLGAIAFRASRRARPLLIPLALLLLAILVPDPGWGGLLFFVSLMTMFGLAIGARARKTVADEQRQLAAHGPSPWLGQSRRSSVALIGAGVVGMLIGTATDGSGQTSSPLAIILFFAGSVMLGMGLFRRHTVLVFYLGRSRARWLEVVQIGTAFLAYSLATAGEFSRDPSQRLAFRLMSLIPFAFHFLVVWIPLAKAQERQVLPETPFA
jgi:F0F1-type ATP synthase assembly protein I